jgi:TorA maturation chaperone TorD
MGERAVNKMRELVRSREDTYGFLAGIFREELTTEQIKQLIDQGIPTLMADAGCKIDSDFFENKPIEQIQEELACEYAGLFIGPGDHIPPYESIYVADDSGKVGYYWGECTVDLKNWVEHYGLKISENFESIPDHISTELEFMQRVVEQERLSWEKEDRETAESCIEVEQAFFDKHINTWVSRFCERIMETAKLDFYKEVAKLAKDFITGEAELLKVPSA